MNDDATLLRRYADEGSEDAFTELVHRHVDLVYTVAMRRTNRDSHAAADVAQQVFTKLAQSASKLSCHSELSAWLYVATRNAALDLMTSQQRRLARESEAAARAAQSQAEAAADWEKLRPLLDSTVDELLDRDRAAIVLRFMLRKTFAEIGTMLQVTEDTARMRTTRALEKMRGLLKRRGIHSTAAALGVAVANQPLISAPTGLAATLTAQSLAAATSSGIVAAALTYTSFMSTKAIVSAGVIAGCGIAIGMYFGRIGSEESRTAMVRETSLEPQVAALKHSNQSLQAEVDHLHAQVARLSADNTQLNATIAQRAEQVVSTPNRILGWMPRYEQQRLVMMNLRQVDAARSQSILEKGKAPESIRELVGIDSYIKTIRPIADEDYANLSMEKGKPLSVTMSDGSTVTYDPAGVLTTLIDFPPEVKRVEELQRKLQQQFKKIGPEQQSAVEAYRLANQGKDPSPSNFKALIPYFSTPQNGADFVELLEVQKELVEAQKIAHAAQKAATR